jgi:hypothetical protein
MQLMRDRNSSDFKGLTDNKQTAFFMQTNKADDTKCSHNLRIFHCRHSEAGDLQTIFHIQREQGTQIGNAV